MEQQALIIGFAAGLTEVAKSVGLPARLAPLSSLLFAICGAFLINEVSWVSVLNGVIFGLTASGLWSGAKAVFN